MEPVVDVPVVTTAPWVVPLLVVLPPVPLVVISTPGTCSGISEAPDHDPGLLPVWLSPGDVLSTVLEPSDTITVF